MTINANPRPARVVSPGRVIKRELTARGWTQKDLAKIMGRPPQAISEIVQGKKSLTPNTAVQLAQAFGTSPELWINLESKYRLHLAQQKAQDPDIIRKRKIYELLPVRELQKRGWLYAGSEVTLLEQSVCKFLEIKTLDESPRLAIRLRHTPTRIPEYREQLAWTKRVQHLAYAQEVKSFNRDSLREAIPDLLRYAERAENIRQVPYFLHDLGVHFVIVPHLPHTYIDGAALTGSNPIVALTLRYSRVDNFWFTLLHEIAHIVAGHKGIYLDDLDDRSENEIEREANQLAQEWLIPEEAYTAFRQECTHPISRAAVLSFAKAVKRHPGIIVGRLHHDNLVPYKNFRRLLVNVKPYLNEWIDAVPDSASK